VNNLYKRALVLFMTHLAEILVLEKNYIVRERFDIMGVNVSRPQRRTKVKYIQANNYDEEPNVFDDSEKFLNESSQQQSAKENTMRGAKNSLKCNQPGFFQLKSGKGRSKCKFDSLDTIDSRKSVPFAALPENNCRASTSSPRGGNEDSRSVHSEEETIFALEKGSKVLYLDEPPDDLEQERDLIRKCEGALREKDGTIFSYSRSENEGVSKVSSASRKELADGRET